MDIGKALKAAQTLVADAYATGTHNGVAIDTKGFDEVLFVVNSGTNEAGATVDIKIQECATSGGTYADITGAAFTQITTSNDNAVYQGRVRMTPTRERYLRAVAVVATDAADCGVVALLGDAQNLPAATPAFDIHT